MGKITTGRCGLPCVRSGPPGTHAGASVYPPCLDRYGCPIGEGPSERMFDDRTLMSTRETAAVLALMARRDRALPWQRPAGAIKDEGRALPLLDRLEAAATEQLFTVDEKRVTLDQLEDRVDGWENEGISLVTVLDAAYPVNLRMVHDRPPALFVRGHLDGRDERSVAIVGTRSAPDRGLGNARTIAHELVTADYVVVSGLAAGIDTAGHEATLAAGGRTVAVIGTGLRESFPRANAALQERLGRGA